MCSSIYGFSLAQQVLVGSSPPNFSCGMESRTVDEDWVQELPLGCSLLSQFLASRGSRARMRRRHGCCS